MDKSTKLLQLELEKLHELINRTTSKDVNTARKAEVSFLQAKEAAQELLSNAELFHDNIFTPVGLNGMKNGENCLISLKLIDLCNEHDCKEIHWLTPSRYSNEKQSKAVNKTTLDEAYVVWDKDVINALAELMKNLRHGKGQILQIPEQWGNIQDSYAAWGRIYLDEKCIWIEFASYKTKSVKSVLTEMSDKPYILAIQEINCMVKYEETKQGHIVTRLAIPYAHTLRPSSI